MKKFSDRLRHVRLLRRYTQTELAQRAGLSQSAVASYESGERQSSRAIFKLASALGVQAQWLDTGKGPMTHADGTPPTPSLADSGNRAYVLMETQREAAHSAAGAWPFTQTPRSHYDNLEPHNKQLLETLVGIFLEACEATELSLPPRKKPRRRD